MFPKVLDYQNEFLFFTKLRKRSTYSRRREKEGSTERKMSRTTREDTGKKHRQVEIKRTDQMTQKCKWLKPERKQQ